MRAEKRRTVGLLYEGEEKGREAGGRTERGEERRDDHSVFGKML